MIKAAEKEKALRWAVDKLEEVDDVESVDRIEKWAYPRIKGSNERKQTLWDAVEAAKKRISEDQ